MKGSRLLRIAIAALALTLLGTSGARALTLQPLNGSFAEPTYVSSDPSDADRLFVVERKGTIQLLEDGARSLFADLSSKVGCGASCEGERGLMSIALAPDFDSSGRLYVDYANDLDGTIHIDELIAAGPAHSSASLATLRPLLSIPHAEAANHNGGQLQFGPDGFLYVSTGDGGGGDDEFHHAQDPASPLGKILRIAPSSSGSYTVWSLGLRNPFRFSFDRASGDMVIGDVGQKLREEVDLAPSPFPGVVGGAGTNYGWNCFEGLIAGPPPPDRDPECATPPASGYTDPVFEYSHTAPQVGGIDPCAIIGGYVARDRSLGDLYGRYVYGDLCVGEIRSLDLSDPFASDRSEQLSAPGLNSFGEDSCGRLYVVEEGGRVYRIAGAAPAVCSTPATPATQPATQPPATIAKPAAPTFIGIKAERRRVERGKRALLTVWVSPCDGRRGATVELLRNGHPNGSRFLNRACTARFTPRIRSGSTFAAATHEERGYLPGGSRRLMIRLAYPPKR